MARKCKHDECDDDARTGGLGWCQKHYYRVRRHGDPDFKSRTTSDMSDRERFDFHGYEVVDGCWIWGGPIGAGGYGTLKTTRGDEKAHRLSFRLFVRELQPGSSVLHECDTPACVNPSHLSEGDHGLNMQDMWNKGRHPKTKRQTTPEQELEICRYWEESRHSAKATRDKFGISNTHLYRILHRNGWL